MRLRVSYYALLLAAVCAVVVAALYFWREARNSSVEALMARLPAGDAVVFYVDAEALRAAGLIDLLAGKASEIDAEYAQFVRQSGFDYTTDLDSALVSLRNGTTYFLLRGRFDWDRLFEYVEDSGGDCANGFCRLYASPAERFVSFFAVTPSIMAMASGETSWDAIELGKTEDTASENTAPDSPFWLTIPGHKLHTAAWLPDGTKSFATAVDRHGAVTFTVGPSGGDFEVKMKVECRGPVEAARLATELKRVTDLLTSLINREGKQPSQADLSGPLTAGVFDQQGSQVRARWPVSRALLENIASGTAALPESR